MSDINIIEVVSSKRYTYVLEMVAILKPRINRGSYMSAHILLNLLNELGKRDKMRGSFNKSIITEHECKNLFII